MPYTYVGESRFYPCGGRRTDLSLTHRTTLRAGTGNIYSIPWYNTVSNYTYVYHVLCTIY